MELGGPQSIGGARAADLLAGLDRAIVLAVNERTCGEHRGTFDRDSVRALMDPLDTGEQKLPSAWKNAVSYSPYPDLRPENWEGKGFPERIERLVRVGAEIKPLDEPEVQGPRAGDVADPKSEAPLGAGRFCDHMGVIHQFKLEDGQYAYPDKEHFERGAAECDRAMLVGHLEPVPA